MDFWCYRCRRTYRSRPAFHQHLRDSPKHHECPECNFDGTTWDNLLQHLRTEGCRHVCQGCDHGRGAYMGWWDYREHLKTENVCTTCGRHFTSPSHLYQHELSHRAHDIECHRCTSRFKTYSGMIIHLEYGTCSNVDIDDLNRVAVNCVEWEEFVEEDYYQDLHYGFEIYGNPFKCPTCDAHFGKLSSLFQHIESSSCDQTLYDNGIDDLCEDIRYHLS